MHLLWAFLFGLVALFCFKKRRANYPPGPIGLPIVGNLPFIGKDLLEKFDEYAKKYGDIFSIQLGIYNVVVLNSLDTIKDAFKDERFAGRPQFYSTKHRNDGNHGILFADGSGWREMRRFTLRTLRDFGLGRTSLENIIKDEIVQLIECLKRDSTEPLLLQNRFSISVVNALWTITTGARYDIEDPVIQKRTQDITVLAQASVTNVQNFLPFLRFVLPSVWKGLKWRVAFHESVKNDFKGLIKEHIDNDYDTHDFINSFLMHAEEQPSHSEFHGQKGLTHLKLVLLDLFVAGAETTSTTMSWFFLLMALNPDIQKKIHDEIDSNIPDKPPSLEDKQKLVYTEAAIQETMRFVTLLPVSLAHRTVVDIDFKGYHIPKDTVILGNLHRVHRNPSVWERPNDFYPEHFMNGKQMDFSIPFSTGKRVCLGESLARMQLFLFIASLMQVFRFEVPDPSNPPSLYSVPSLVRGPRPHELKLILRKNV